MTTMITLQKQVTERFGAWIDGTHIAFDELTVEVKAAYLRELCLSLRDEDVFDFKLLVDVCGVDYLHYGLDDWETASATDSGFGRGTLAVAERKLAARVSRYAVVYHLLSLTHHHRIRLRVNIPEDGALMVDSVINIWPAADWFERETFDLFGILFKGHPDLRRILTDYGFHGHPFRKDFPLIGEVEARYDAKLKRVVYEPVSIQPRILEPKVIRRDNRYLG